MGLVVDGHRSDLGRWRAAQRPAEPRLRDYVLGYFASEGFLPRPLHERHLPSREVAIVLNFAAPHRIINPSDPTRTTEHRNAWIVALQHRHHIHEAFGARDFMVIRLTPIGAQMLLGVPMDLLTDRTLALEDVDSRFSRLLTEHAEATHDWAARFDIVENIIARTIGVRAFPSGGSAPCSWRILRESPNSVDLARLPEEFGCSRRHLIAQFHRYFGMAPKTIARISRFHLAVAAVHRVGRRDPLPYAEGKPYLDSQADACSHAAQTTMRWTDLALGCGYYDQSHFINEFRSFSGLSPRRIPAADSQRVDSALSMAVKFFQYSAPFACDNETEPMAIPTQAEIEDKLRGEDLDTWLDLWRVEQGPAKPAALKLIAAAIPFPIDQSLRVLDVGCGPGDAGRAIHSRFPHARIDSVDRNEFFVSLCGAVNRRDGIGGRTWAA